MQDEYIEEKSINPLKIGIFGALIIAAIVVGLLQFRAYSRQQIELEKEQIEYQKQLSQLRMENKELKEKIAELEEISKTTADSWQKQIRQMESRIVALRKQKENEIHEAEARFAQLKKEKEKAEESLEQMKKDLEIRKQELQRAQDQMARFQTELKNYTGQVKTLQAKLKKIEEGDRAAADLMVEQLAEAKQQLKRERALREQLEKELNRLRESVAPPPQ